MSETPTVIARHNRWARLLLWSVALRDSVFSFEFSVCLHRVNLTDENPARAVERLGVWVVTAELLPAIDLYQACSNFVFGQHLTTSICHDQSLSSRTHCTRK